MKPRLLIAGILAGLAVFLWGFFSHTVLGLVEGSIKTIPNEPVVMTAMSENIKESGFYFFPGAGMDSEKVPEGQKEALMHKWDEDYKKLPHGILIVTQPTGGSLPFAKHLSTHLVTEILGGLIAAFLLSLAAPSLPSFTGKVLFVAALGFFSSLSIDVPYWNWYGFPTNYLLSSFVDSTVGWALGGVVLALMLRRYSER